MGQVKQFAKQLDTSAQDLVDGAEAAPERNDPLVPDTDLTSTVGAFENRIQRKKKEKESFNEISDRAAKQRQTLMLETMANMRRSLVKVARIDLGERFTFSMDFDDWQGWPRLVLKLNDSLLPEVDYPFFQVLAHDRLNRATIEINWGASPKPERVFLEHPNELLRLPIALKKSVRLFLDLIENIILNAETGAQQKAEQEIKSKILETANDEESQEQEIISGDLFVDGALAEDFLGALPQLDALDNLTDNNTSDE